MCTEVFQVERPTSAANTGVIIPVTLVVNTSNEHPLDSGRSSKWKNRRIINNHPIPLAGSACDRTKEHAAESPEDTDGCVTCVCVNRC